MEHPFLLAIAGADTLAILHQPDHPSGVGVLILVGGPQYRIGAHRQYVVLARHLAAMGIAAMRFDYRGIGDSTGIYPGFENIAIDIRTAIEAFRERSSGLEKIVLWGLCEGASSILLQPADDLGKTIAGIILVNPWVRTPEGQARTYLQHYYTARLWNPGFWRKLRHGEVNFLDSATGLWRSALTALGGAKDRAQTIDEKTHGAFPERMAVGLANFTKPVLLVLSGRDLTAKEFEDVAKRSGLWKKALAGKNVTTRKLEDADHTFSTREWHQQLSDWITEWANALVAQNKHLHST